MTATHTASTVADRVTVACKCRTHKGQAATLPASLLADLKVAEGARFRPHLIVSNAYATDSVSAIVRARLNLEPVL